MVDGLGGETQTLLTVAEVECVRLGVELVERDFGQVADLQVGILGCHFRESAAHCAEHTAVGHEEVAAPSVSHHQSERLTNVGHF